MRRGYGSAFMYVRETYQIHNEGNSSVRLLGNPIRTRVASIFVVVGGGGVWVYISSLKCSWFIATLCVPPVACAIILHMCSSADRATTDVLMFSCFSRSSVTKISPGSHVDNPPKTTSTS